MNQIAVCALILVAGCHEDGAPPAAPTASNPPAPVESGIDESAIDSSLDPCDDFYQYACGNWIKRTEIPADKSYWARGFSVIDDRNQKELRAILESAAKGEGDAKLGAYWQSCTNEAAIEDKGPAELKAQLLRVDAIDNLPSLIKEVARIHLGIGNPIFETGQEQDFKDATQV